MDNSITTSTTSTNAASAVAPLGGEKRRVLGRGLESLLPSKPLVAQGSASSPAALAVAIKPEDQVQHLDVTLVDASPYQTRSLMNARLLADLTESVRVSGVLQPVTVRAVAGGRYQLITGERRLRASIAAEHKTIPAIVRVVADQVAAEMTIIENLQRADLNPIEQARAYQQLSTRFQLTQEEVAKRMGVERSSVANHLRLLKLSAKIQGYVESGDLSFSHARLFASLDSSETWTDSVAKSAAENGWSVKRLGEVIEDILTPTPKAEAKPKPPMDPNVKEAQSEMERVLGVRVRIKDHRGRGKIIVEYNSLDDFDRVVSVLSGE